MILFGGDANLNGRQSELTNQTWAYDFNANAWIERNPTIDPPARWFFDMTYDAESDRVILFGGDLSDDPGGESNDTWSYNFNANTWEEMSPPSRPSPRSYHRLVYDAESDRIILFGGNIRPGGISSETWAYDYNMDTWQNMHPVSSPSPRYAYGLSYDADSDQVILFGGFGWTGTEYGYLNDTWAYDYNTNQWTELSPSAHPRFRAGHSMVYDSESDRVVLFGGGRPRIDDTWAYDYNTNTWVGLIILKVRPRARNLHAMAYDSESDRVVLFGGFVECVVRPQTCQYGRNNETWAYDYDENRWTPLTPPLPPRYLAAASDDIHIKLSWYPSSHDGGVSVTKHRIYRGTVPGDLSFLVELGDSHSYIDTGVALGVTYYYQVSAVTSVGEGSRSSEVNATPFDATSPSIEITSPEDGAMLSSSTLDVTGTAFDNVAVEKVELSLDGTTWVPATGKAMWNGTLALSEGVNTIHARATDSSGNSATSRIEVTYQPRTSPDLVFVGIGVGGGLAAAITIVLLLLRRRRR